MAIGYHPIAAGGSCIKYQGTGGSAPPLNGDVRPAFVTGSEGESFNTVIYQGQTIDVSKTYPHFHAYRDDPDNLPIYEIPRVIKLVNEAPPPSDAASRDELQDAFFKLMFPGYGLSLLALGRPVALFSVEIPRTQDQRYFAYAERNGRWVLKDDFVWPSPDRLIEWAEVSGEAIRYFNSDGSLVREKR